MRMTLRPWRFAGLVAAGLIWTFGALRADPGATVSVNAEVKGGAVRLQARATGPFEYTTYRPSDNFFVVDLSGVSTAEPAGARVLDSDLVSSYRLLQFRANGKPVVRLELLLHSPAEPRVLRQGPRDLTLVVARPGSAGPSDPASQPVSQPTSAPPTTSAAVQELSAGPSAVIKAVELGQMGPETQVVVRGASPLTYHALRLSHPDRLVLDFADARVRMATRTIPSNLDPVREVRIGQFAPRVARIVIDLREAAPYRIKSDGPTVTVGFTPAGEPGDVKSAEPPAPRIEKTLAADPTSVGSVHVQEISAQRTSVATNLDPPTAPAGPASEVGTSAAPPSPAPVTPDPETSKPSAVQAQPGAPPAQKYTGEPISVNLKDVDLRDFFRLIHEISGLNVVVDPNVKGSLTIVLDNVPWDQALDLVLRNNDLEKQLEGNVLRIATRQTVKKEAEEARDLAKAQAEAADVVTTTRVLSYAKAEDLVPTLKKFLSSRGDILADKRSNTLIIRDIPSVLPVMDNLIRQLDRKSQQVEIEARVVAANRSFAREIGSQFAFASSATRGRNIWGGATGVGTSPIIRSSPPLPVPPLVVGAPPSGGTVTSQMPLVTNLAATTATSGVSYAFSSPNFALDYIITAAETRGVGKLLSKPKIITQNNEKATVKQGTKIPIQTIVNNTISVQFVDAVLKLEVTPQITSEGTVFMDVTVENDQIDPAIPRVNGIPAIDTQSAETKVLINDGGTVVIGGIILSQQRTDIAQVPLFGSLPLIGHLFKRTTVSSTSQELLFFLTPRILPS